MPLNRLLILIIASGAAFLAIPAGAQTFGTCTVAGTSPTLASASSFAVAQTAQQGSGSSGMSCGAISVATTSYLKADMVNSTFLLTGPGGRTIPFIVSFTNGGPALVTGSEVDFSGFSLLQLFVGPGGSVPIYIRTVPTSGLAAGTYTGTVSLRWHFAVCSLGVAVCLAWSESPNFVRPGPFNAIDWGPGVPVTLNLSLTVGKDCMVTAPDVDFGTAALISQFNPVTRTISIRCSADASYSVGLSNGDNYAGASRRMRSGADYLRYELYKGTSGTARWGPAGTERRASTDANSNPGIYNGITLQGFAYRAVIDPAQATPPAGQYSDTIILDVAF